MYTNVYRQNTNDSATFWSKISRISEVRDTLSPAPPPFCFQCITRPGAIQTKLMCIQTYTNDIQTIELHFNSKWAYGGHTLSPAPFIFFTIFGKNECYTNETKVYSNLYKQLSHISAQYPYMGGELAKGTFQILQSLI